MVLVSCTDYMNHIPEVTSSALSSLPMPKGKTIFKMYSYKMHLTKLMQLKFNILYYLLKLT